MLLTQKLPDPRTGNVASQGVTLHQSPTPDPRSANRVCVTGPLTALGGGVSHEKDLKTSSEEGMVANRSRVLRNPGRSRGLGGQMHKKQHQRGFLFCSQPARGRGPGRQVHGAAMVLDTSLEAGSEECTPHTSHGTQLWTPRGRG